MHYMTKYGLTKARIVDLIDQGVNNLSDLSKNLNLAPSTVSKHLDELESLGIIKLKHDGYARKWKHYEVIRAAQQKDTKNKDMGPYHSITLEKVRNRIVLPMVVIVVIASLAYFFSVADNSSSLLNIPVSITDPPHVPIGTQALYINYSSFEVLVNGTGSPQWVPINSSGRIDLMSIINVSDIVATLKISPKDSIHAVKFNISSASIIIDNVTYPVKISNSTVSAHLDTLAKLNSSSDLLVDLSPTVIPVYTNGSYRFVLLPFLSAAFGIDNEHAATVGSQMRAGVQSQAIVKRYIISNNPFYRHANISVTKPIIVTSSNKTSFSVNIRNTGSTGITVYGIILEEDSTRQFASSVWRKVFNETNSSVSINASAIYEKEYAMHNRYHWTEKIALPHPANIIIISGFEGNTSPFDVFIQWRLPRCIDFSAEKNGVLKDVASPFSIYNSSSTNASYVLLPFSNETFTYQGRLYRGISNASYEVLVLTNVGVASASFPKNMTHDI
ncbi:MAG: helix-turn-helix domain-containing protein [Candidatus Micrarchaeia archaeon]